VAYIGFWVSSVVGITVIACYLSLAVQRPSLVKVLGWVAIITGEVTFFYLIFTRLLDVPLPADILF
jgi:hypothetical protein